MGKAYLVKHSNTNKEFVIKTVDITKMRAEDKEATRHEVDLLSSLNHPNVVRFVKVFVGEKSKQKRLCIVMEYADDGDLQQKI